MDHLIRRIVTGTNDDGKAIFESDNKPPIAFLHEEWPGFNNIEFWQTEHSPPTLQDKYDSNRAYDFNLAPGIVRFCTMRLPPLQTLITHLKSLGKEVDLKTFGMHKTDTIDYLVLLEGEVTLILEGGEEKTLQPGDTVVQKPISMPGIIVAISIA